MTTKENPQKDNHVICGYPFYAIRNGPSINYAPCCWARTKSVCGPQNTPAIDYFKGNIFNEMRRDMLRGVKSDLLLDTCSLCYKNEENNGSSARLQSEVDWSVLDNFDSDGKMIDNNNRFIKLELNAFGNHCNLECYECQPDNSSRREERLKKMGTKWQAILGKYSFVDRDVKKKNKVLWREFVNDLVQHSRNIKMLSFCGGEPMSMVSHFDILDALIDSGDSKEIELYYVSNMTMFTLPKMRRYIDKFKWMNIQWSVDGIGERNYWLRYPTNWNNTVKNVLDVQQYLYYTKPWKIGKIEATITPSLLGVLKLRETVDWMNKHDLMQDNPMINRIDEPKICQTRHLPDEIKQKIGDDVKSVSEYHYNDMMEKRDPYYFGLAIKYFDALDKSRGTDWRATFPELACYTN
tara:strand:- start:20913 stop:22136 length:1224 start_codon:yes stop_codon:yes gene_type:complete